MNSLLSSNNNRRDNYFQKIMQRDPSGVVRASGQQRKLFAGTSQYCLYLSKMVIVYVLEPPLTTEWGQVSFADDQYNILSV